MASPTKVSTIKRKRRHKNAGKERKKKSAQKSTLSYAELFAGCGEPSDSTANNPAEKTK